VQAYEVFENGEKFSAQDLKRAKKASALNHGTAFNLEKFEQHPALHQRKIFC
jgi:hypothetical protein